MDEEALRNEHMGHKGQRQISAEPLLFSLLSYVCTKQLSLLINLEILIINSGKQISLNTI